MNFILRKFIPLLIIMCLGIFLSANFAWKVYDLQLEKDVIAFKRQTENYMRAVRELMRQSLYGLSSFKTSRDSSTLMSHSEFKSVAADMIRKYAFIESLLWVPIVKESNRAEFENMAKIQGPKNFYLKELNDRKEVVTAQSRTIHYPIYFAESASQKDLVGFDLAADVVKRQALDNSLKNGESIFTQYIKIDGQDGQLGMLMIQPVYAEGVNDSRMFKGFVVGVFNISSFLGNIWQNQSVKDMKIAVFDVSAPVKRIVLHLDGLDLEEANHPILKNDRLASEFYTSYLVNAGTKVWQVIISPRRGLHISEYWEPIIVLIISTGLTMVIVFYIYMIIKREEKVTKLVEERTKNLTLINEQLNKEITERAAIEQKMQDEKKRMQTFLNLSAARELQMIQLKEEINELYRQTGKVPPFDLSFLEKKHKFSSGLGWVK